MYYTTTSLGAQAGVYIRAGIEFGYSNVETVNDLEGWGINVGATAALATLKLGVEGGAVVKTEEGEDSESFLDDTPDFGDDEINGILVVAPPKIGAGFGLTAYLEGAYTENLLQTDWNEIIEHLYKTMPLGTLVNIDGSTMGLDEFSFTVAKACYMVPQSITY